MVSIVTGLCIALGIAICAKCKGRTGWHWFMLNIVAFAAVWISSFVGLRLAEMPLTLDAADSVLAIFAGGMTGAVMLIVLLSVPYRPKPVRGQVARAPIKPA